MLKDVRLSNVLLNDGTRSKEHPELYVKTTSGQGAEREGAQVLSDATSLRHDFATYVNAFSNVKWHRYANVGDIVLTIVAKGTFDVTYVGYHKSLGEPRREVFDRASFELEDFEAVDYRFPESDATLFAFEVDTAGETLVREAYWHTEVEEDLLRPVELAIATTTFRKEDFVVPNIELIKREVLGCAEDVASHFTLHVIDNGRTLDADALEDERVHVHPNANVGGAGGFSYGMICAMEQEPKATHVLLMDDDVEVSAESIKRTYNLLRLVRDEYARSFISGAMLCLERPTQFKEDIGYIGQAATYGAAKTRLEEQGPFDVASLSDMIDLEALEPRRLNTYAAWWYCVIPVALIEEKGLGLPVFIRGDDAEYGNRVAEGFMTMNGICIWHLMSSGVFRAGMERYYPIRNSFIAQFASGIYQNIDFLPSLHYQFGLDLKTFNYASAEVCLMAVEDFLKGPEYLKHLNTERFNQQLSALNEKIVPIEELARELPEGLEYNIGDLEATSERSLATRLYDFLTFNGQRGPKALAQGGIAVIPYNGWYYPANEIRGKDTLVCLTEDGTGGVIRHKDRERFKRLNARYGQLLKEFHDREEELRQLWSSALGELTSVEFWKWYLADQAREA